MKSLILAAFAALALCSYAEAGGRPVARAAAFNNRAPVANALRFAANAVTRGPVHFANDIFRGRRNDFFFNNRANDFFYRDRVSFRNLGYSIGYAAGYQSYQAPIIQQDFAAGYQQNLALAGGQCGASYGQAALAYQQSAVVYAPQPVLLYSQPILVASSYGYGYNYGLRGAGGYGGHIHQNGLFRR